MNNLISVPPLIGPPDNVDNSATPDQAQDGPSSDQSELNVIDGNGSEQWNSTTSATAELFLCGAEESADAFHSLKSVLGDLCSILDNHEVWRPSSICYPQHLQVPQQTKANKQAIELLAPRVKALSASLCKPISEGDTNGEARRKELEW